MMKKCARVSIIGLLVACMLVAQSFASVAQRQPATAKKPATHGGPQPELVVQLGHTGGVTSVAFSPDMRFAVTGGNDNFAVLWSTETGAEVNRFAGHEFMVEAVAISPLTGRFVATGSEDKTARVWDIATAKSLLAFNEHTSSVYAIAFSPNEQWVLTGSSDDTARLWDRESGKTERVFKHPNSVKAVAFADQGRRILTGCADGIARLWDTENGNLLMEFKGHKDQLTAAAISADGRYVVTASYDKTVRLWDAQNATELRQLVGHSPIINADAVAFSPDSTRVLTGAADGTARLWDTASGKALKVFTHLEGRWPKVSAVTFSADGHKAMTGAYDNTACLWDVASGDLLRRFGGIAHFAYNSVASPDGRYLLVNTGYGVATLWDLTTGQPLHAFGDDTDSARGALGLFSSVAFSADSRLIAIANATIARVWNIQTEQLVREIKGRHTDHITSVAFATDNRFLVTGSLDKTARLWNLETGAELYRLDHDYPVHAVAVSPDSRYVLTGSGADKSPLQQRKADEEWPCAAILWDAGSGNKVRRFYHPFQYFTAKPPDHNVDSIKGKVLFVAFSKDGQQVVTGNENGTAHLWQTATGAEVQFFPGGYLMNGLALSADGRRLITSSVDKDALVWDVATGTVIERLTHPGFVISSTFSADSRFVITTGWDRLTRFWDREAGTETCRIVSLAGNDWAAVVPDGRFDTNDLEEVRGLRWRMADDPLNPLPLEIFMRDYYEPRLLPRALGLVAGDKLDPISNRDLSQLNRVQPIVKITRVAAQADPPDTVTVTVDVSKPRDVYQFNGSRHAVETGVYDLRLSRDDQLIDYAPKPNPEQSPRAGLRESLPHWRDRTRIELNGEGRATVIFKNVKLPHRQASARVEFSAYAFNEDRVKSATSRVAIRNSLAPIKGRAYIVTIGVKTSESPVWELTYAARDARQIGAALAAALTQTNEYEDVVTIPLVSAIENQLMERPATKANIETVLRLLAGKPVDEQTRRGIPNVDRIKPARPEDVLVISVSSHGVTDNSGNFYLVPYDVGIGRGRSLSAALLRHCVSSDELSEWLRDVDAGEMAMIVDACHAEAAIKAGGFKPGPMGSRGLGQLAFDKRMKILAASEATGKAYEDPNRRLSYVTSALVEEGLNARLADKDKDGYITLNEWLTYAVARVPLILEAAQAQAVPENWQGQTATGARAARAANPSAKPPTQKPALFDFSKQTHAAWFLKM